MRFRARCDIAPAVFLMAAVLASGCAKKNSIVDPTYTLPEGRTTALAKLVTWVDRGGTSLVYAPDGVETRREDDLLLPNVFQYPPAAPGAVRMNLLNGTEASAFQLFRREPSGGFTRLRDYDVLPGRKWLDGHWSLTDETDLSPYPGVAYVARGVVDGAVTAESPLTNVAQPELATPVPATLEFDIAGSDSLQRFAWTGDPAAAGYLLEVIPLGDLSSRQERMDSGSPAPFLTSRVRDIVSMFVPAGPTPSIVFGLEGVSPTVNTSNAVLFANQRFTPFGFYVVRIVAIDPSGRVINRLRPIFPYTYDFIQLNDPDLPDGAYEALPIGGPVLVYGPTPPPPGKRADSIHASLGWQLATNR